MSRGTIPSMVGGLILTTLIWAPEARAGMIDESGLKPWEACALCHSLDGVSRMAKFPKLAGQVPAYIEKQIRDFRQGRRANDGGQMKAMADIIAEKDIPVVARYFGGLKPPPPAAAISTATLKTAEKLFTSGDVGRSLPSCQSCHGEDRLSNSGAPRIKAQHEGYIVKQLFDFRGGDRGNDPDGVMATVAKILTDSEINALGGYLAAQIRMVE